MRALCFPLSALALLAACGEVNSSDPDASVPSVDAPIVADASDPADASESDAAPEPKPDAGPADPLPPLGEWSPPQLLDLSTPPGRELSPTATADGLELWFLRIDGTSETLWRTRRATTSHPWEAAEEFPRSSGLGSEAIEISPDGLEMFTRASGGVMRSMRRTTRESAWPTTAGQPADIFASTSGDLPTLSADGLTIYYTAAGFESHLVKRQRFNRVAAWGEPTPAEFEYPRPPRGENERTARYASIDLRADTLLLSSPSSTSLNKVGQLTRDESGAWQGFRDVTILSINELENCELVTRAEAICVRSRGELVRVTRRPL